MTAAKSGAAMAADRVNFVDEYDAGGVLFRLFEHVADARSTHTHEHLNEVGARNREKRHFRLAGNGPRQQSLAGSRRTDHEHTLRDLAAKFLELAGIFQEV